MHFFLDFALKFQISLSTYFIVEMVKDDGGESGGKRNVGNKRTKFVHFNISSAYT